MDDAGAVRPELEQVIADLVDMPPGDISSAIVIAFDADGNFRVGRSGTREQARSLLRRVLRTMEGT